MGTLGCSLTGPRERGREGRVNSGAGAVSFDFEGAPITRTYFAINAGAELTCSFNRNVGFGLLPQGDIAFTRQAGLKTSTARVWPVSVGFRIRS